MSNWQEKRKYGDIFWLHHGDTNSKNFHLSTMARQRHNIISQISLSNSK